MKRWGWAWLWALTSVAWAGGEHLASRPAQETLEQWANDPAWHAMLYYRASGFGPSAVSGVESEADDPAFFLAPAGKSDPLAELKASLVAFAQPQPAGNAHPQCRFPARYHWLKQRHGSPLATAVDQSCPDFEAFRTRLSATGVTMVYPVPNMDDVSTLFGHSFLRLDRDRAPDVDKSEDYTLNFAALVKKGDGQSDLVVNGLFGELDGIFTVLPYRKKLTEYLSMEARDIWEYRLNLSPAETAQLVRHAWEVRKTHFEYKFFAENCSYRKLNFLDVARPGLGLREQYSVYAIPLDAVETVISAGLVDHVHYQPAEVSRWEATLEHLSEQDIAHFRAGALPRTRMVPANAVPRPLQPGDVGHYSGRVTLSAGVRDGASVAAFGLRPAYHDFLDAPSGGPLAEITVLSLAARQVEGQGIEVTDATFFAASSLKARNALYSPWSWRLATGVTGMRWPASDRTDTIANADDSPDDHEWINPLYARLLMGPAWGGRDVAFYQLFGAEMQAAGAYEHPVEVLALWNPGMVMRSARWQAHLDMLVRAPAAGERDTHGTASASLSRQLSTELAVFLRALREKDVLGLQNETQLGVAWYF